MHISFINVLDIRKNSNRSKIFFGISVSFLKTGVIWATLSVTGNIDEPIILLKFPHTKDTKIFIW